MISFAHVKGQNISHATSVPVENLEKLQPSLREIWEQIPPPRKVAVAGVNPPALKVFETAVADSITDDRPGPPDVLVDGRELPIPIPTDLPHPELIGADRLKAEGDRVEIAEYPPPSAPAVAPAHIDEALKEKLRAIGYFD